MVFQSFFARRARTACVAIVLALAGSSTAALPAHAGAPPTGPPVAVIVQQLPAAGAESMVEALGGQVGHELGVIDGFTARVPADRLDELSAAPGVVSVTKDAGLRLQADNWSAQSDLGSILNAAKATGAAGAWGAGVTGKGVDVALIDSGVAPVDGLNGPNKIVNGPDLSFEAGNPARRNIDTFGHGTHMAGIIAGRDGSSGDGSFTGIAPDARLVSVKVASSDGATDVSQVIDAIGWVVQHGHDNGLNIRVVNLSYSTDALPSYVLDPLASAVESAWLSGVVVVAAAGNDGVQSSTLASPAVDPYVIAVGASDHQGTQTTADDVVAAFSNRGNETRHADLVAPGRSIVSLRDPGSYIDRHHPEGLVAGDGTQRFFRGTGTSQSTAIVSGTVALLLQQRPDLTPDQVKALLTSSAHALPAADALAQGAGLVDVNAALARPTPSARQSFPLARFGGAALPGIGLGGSLSGRSWSGRSWSCTNWTGSHWTGSHWTGSHWTGSHWTGSHWTGSHWTGSHWTGSHWTGSHWTGSHWTGSHWTGSHWTGSHWTGSH